jgi:hypothetical protein
MLSGGLAAAGLVHLVLIPEHFAQSVLFGVVLTCMAALRLALAVPLIRSPYVPADRWKEI